MTARLDLKWEKYGSTSLGSAPPIPHYRCEIGADSYGQTWLCDVHPVGKELEKLLISFDIDAETDDGEPFMRGRVSDAIDYWGAHHAYYHSKYVKYADIESTIRRFIIDYDIEAYDVTCKRVK